jgi:hypothetical protein
MNQNYFVCDGCGYVGKGETPVKCPVCGAEGARFKQVDKSIFEAAAKAEGAVETELAYDDIPMQWTKEAKEAIRAVPAGFQRRRAKAKIEKTARKLGMTTITLEYAAPMIQEAASEEYSPIFANKGAGTSAEAEALLQGTNGTNGSSSNRQETKTQPATAPAPGLATKGASEQPADPYVWTADAQARLERAPEGFMRDCTRALILRHAEKIGTTTITIEVANEGIEESKKYMEEALKSGNLKTIIADLTGKPSA